MRVAVIFTGAYPIGDVTTQRVHNLCRGLVESGAEVEILLANPTEKPGDTRNPLPTGQCDDQGRRSAEHERFPGHAHPPQRPTAASRRIDSPCVGAREAENDRTSPVAEWMCYEHGDSVRGPRRWRGVRWRAPTGHRS